MPHLLPDVHDSASQLSNLHLLKPCEFSLHIFFSLVSLRPQREDEDEDCHLHSNVSL